MTKSRTLRKAGAVVLSLAMAFSVASVPASAAGSIKASKLTVSKSTVTVKPGKSVKITVKINKKNTKNLTIKIASKKKATAKVSASKKVIKKGKTSTSFKITGKAAGNTKVVVKFKKGSKWIKKTITVKVADATTDDDGTKVVESLKVVDLDGYQTDGTAVVNDNLQVQIPAQVGTIDRINWYVDDKLVSTSSTSTGDASTKKADKAGNWVARVVTTKGATYSSDSVKVTATEVRAVASDFKVEDDYDDKFIDFNTADGKAIASVTFNKKYSGQIDVYEYKDGKFVDKTSKGSLSTDNVFDNSEGWSNHELYENSTKGTVTNKASLTHNEDGTVTYKFFFGGKLTRGTNYVAVFNQKKVIDDDVNAAKPNQTNEATAPYVTQPKSITLGPIAKDIAIPVNFLDEAGAKIAWLGTTKGGDALGTQGIKSVKIYADESNAVSTKSTNSQAITSKIEGGVVKSAANQLPGKDDATTPTGNYPFVKSDGTALAWFLGEVVLTKDIFGKGEITLTSVATNTNASVADKAEVKESTTDAKNAEINLTNLAADATIYLIQGKDATDTLAKKIDAFDASKTDSYVKSVEVTKGSKTATIEGAFSAVETNAAKAESNKFAVVIVPKDESNFGMIKSETFTLKQKVTKYALQAGYTYKGITTSDTSDNNTDAYIITGGVFATGASPDDSDDAADYIQVNDQFGNKMSAKAVLADTDAAFGAKRELTFNNDASEPNRDVKIGLNFVDGKKVSMELTATAHCVKVGTVMTAKDNKTGQTFTLKTYRSDGKSNRPSKSTPATEVAGNIYYELTLA